MSHMARSLRRGPIVVEYGRDHDRRAGRDRYHADQRPLFEDRNGFRMGAAGRRFANIKYGRAVVAATPQALLWLRTS